MPMRVGHGPPGIVLRAAARPANHLGGKILKTRRWHLMMGFVHGGICIQTRVGHDAVDEIINNGCDAVDSAQSLVETSLILGRHEITSPNVALCGFLSHTTRS